MSDQRLRAALLNISQHMVELGFNRGTAGNASLRCGDHFFITPSATAVSEMELESMVKMSLQGEVLEGGEPSSEWRIHRDILVSRPETGAVLHMHSIYATTIACMCIDVPAVHYHIAFAGGDNIRCTPYTVFGEQNLSDLALEALRDRKACLLGNHGMIALGNDPEDALAVAKEVEFLCEIYWRTLCAGRPQLITEQQMHQVKEKFVEYKSKRIV